MAFVDKLRMDALLPLRTSRPVEETPKARGFGEEELGAADRFGEDSEGGAGADFAGQGGGGA